MPEYERIYDTTAALLARMEELAEWADANSYDTPIDLPDVLIQAADIIRQSGYELKLTF